MKQLKVLVMDPSGNYNEGDGTTGWVLIDQDQNILSFGNLKSKHLSCRADYHHAHLELIEQHQPNWIVLENFVLYADKASQQINSELETPRLLGVLEHYAWLHCIPLSYQRAVDVKARWADDILVFKKVVTREHNRCYINGMLLSRHIKDAVRHALHFTSFNKEWKEYVTQLSAASAAYTELPGE